MLTVPSIYVCAAVLQKSNNHVLLVQRPSHKSLPEMWEFPGGKINSNERPEDTIIREIYEEIGIKIQNEYIKPLTFISHTYKTFHLNMFVYLCHNWEGEVILKENQKDFAWVHPSNLSKYLIPPADNPIVESLQEKCA